MILQANKKFIDTSHVAHLLTAGEKYADKLVFSVERFYQETDLSGCLFVMRGVNSAGNLALETLSQEVMETAIRLTLNVSPAFTAVSGMLALEIVCYDNSDRILKYTVTPMQVKASVLEEYSGGVDAIEEALKEAEVTLDDIDAIGVTYRPGLVGALLVGVAEAKAIAYAAGKPLVGVHHIEGHIAANFIEHKELEPPFFSLVVSGGHTHLVRVKDYGKFDIIGRTRDDAAGEAFDKVARAIGLGYPGGPKIDKVAREGNPDAIEFPRAKIGENPYDFSFSGVKSAVLNYLNGAKMKGEEVNRADIAASFQKAVVDVLVEHTMQAAADFGMKKIAIAGGVASNGALRTAMEKACTDRGYKFYRPSPIFCTEIAAMIGVAAYYEYIRGTRHSWDLNVVPNLKLGER